MKDPVATFNLALQEAKARVLSAIGEPQPLYVLVKGLSMLRWSLINAISLNMTSNLRTHFELSRRTTSRYRG